MPMFLRRPDVCKRYGIASSTLYDWIAKGQFPVPRRLGVRAVAWAVADLERWDAGRMPTRKSPYPISGH